MTGLQYFIPIRYLLGASLPWILDVLTQVEVTFLKEFVPQKGSPK